MHVFLEGLHGLAANGVSGVSALSGGVSGTPPLPTEDSVLPLKLTSSHTENEEEEFNRLLYSNMPAGRL